MHLIRKKNQQGDDQSLSRSSSNNPGGDRYSRQSAQPEESYYDGRPYDDDAARDQLFSGASGGRSMKNESSPPSYTRDRYANDSRDKQELFKGASTNNRSGAGSGSGSGPSRYDRYGDRYGDDNRASQQQLDMDEEEEIEGIKNQIRYTKQESLATIQNSLAIGRRAEETASRSLLHLGAQSDKLATAERHIDMASARSDVAADKTAELKALNKSIFRPVVGNPFTKAKRQAEYEKQLVDRHERERQNQDDNRKQTYETSQRLADAIEGKGKYNSYQSKGTNGERNLAARSKYQFEGDSEDEALEDGIEDGLDELHGVTSRLKNLAMAMGDEVNVSNNHIDKLTTKTEKVDGKILLYTHKLSKIK